MRSTFVDLVLHSMEKHSNVFVITADLGYKMWDRVRDAFPQRFYNVGAAEIAAIDIGVGLSLSGQVPIIYSITPFLLRRGYESIKLYLDHESIPVKLTGSGRNRDYRCDGISHWAEDALQILSNFPNVKCFFPKNTKDLVEEFEQFLFSSSPSFMSLKR